MNYLPKIQLGTVNLYSFCVAGGIVVSSAGGTSSSWLGSISSSLIILCNIACNWATCLSKEAICSLMRVVCSSVRGLAWDMSGDNKTTNINTVNMCFI